MEVDFTPMISIWSWKNSNLNIDLYHTKVEITITNPTQITGENNEWHTYCILALYVFEDVFNVSLLI